MKLQRVKPLSGWMGGKRKVTPKIVQLLASYDSGKPQTGYGEAFAGMANVLLAKAPQVNENINDINDNLVTLFDVVRTQREELIKSYQYVPISRTIFLKYRDLFEKNVYDSSLHRAHVYLYLLLVGYGCKMDGFSAYISGARMNSLNHNTLPGKIDGLWERLKNVNISCMPYDRFIDQLDDKNVVFFLDPPYFDVAGYGNDIHWGEKEFHYFKEVCQSINGGFVLTVNAKPLMYSLFEKDFHIIEHGVKYSMGHGEDEHATPELLITNFTPSTYAIRAIQTKDAAHTKIVQASMF